MTTLREAAQQALEALEYGQHSLKQVSEYQWESRGELAMHALRAALAQQAEPQPMHPELRKMWEDHFDKCFRAIPVPEQAEPVAVFDARWGQPVLLSGAPLLEDEQPLYTAPPQRKPLTEEEIAVLEAKYAPPVHPDFADSDDWVDLIRAVERAHGIGEWA